MIILSNDPIQTAPKRAIWVAAAADDERSYLVV